METVLILLLCLGVLVAFAINRYERKSFKKNIAMLELRNVALQLECAERRKLWLGLEQLEPTMPEDTLRQWIRNSTELLKNV